MDLPDLITSRCRVLTACGRLASQDAGALKLVSDLNNKGRLVAPYGNDASSNMVLLWGGGIGKGCERHVHIDVVRADFKPRPPKENTQVGIIQTELAVFEGQPADVNVEARFAVPMAELPERGLILGSRLQMEMEDIAIRQTGAVFSFTRGPVEKIEWLASREPNVIDVELQFKLNAALNRDYLTVLLQAAQSALNRLIFGRES